MGRPKLEPVIPMRIPLGIVEDVKALVRARRQAMKQESPAEEIVAPGAPDEATEA